jgi:hypothetical protein
MVGTSVLDQINARIFPYTSYDAYSAGSAYSLTATAAALVFGTTQPSITIVAAGTYRIRARVVLKLNGATFAANQTITLKCRRTNNTAGDLANSSTALLTGIVTALTGPLAVVALPDVEYTAAAGDTLSIFGSVGVIPSLGSLDTTEASIHALRVA